MRRIVENLDGEYGPKTNDVELDAIGTVVETILSQQNSDVSTRAVYAELRRRFPTWEAVRDADPGYIEDAIRKGGLERQKAARIKRFLESVGDDRGALDLRFLEALDVDEALAYLLRFNGIGPKTARCTLLFAFDKPVFPMDVHIFRILERVGVLDPRLSDERAHQQIQALVPPGKHYTAHINLIQHGRSVCRPTAPACDRCCLIDYCAHGQERLTGQPAEDPRLRSR